MNDFLLLKSIGEGIAELKSKYNNISDSEKEKVRFEIEKLSDEYKKVYQMSLKNSLIITEYDMEEIEKLRKEINSCANATEILETIKNLFLVVFNISSNIINTVKRYY